jgi:predicted anti-sigma-YlaC factor YlaD
MRKFLILAAVGALAAAGGGCSIREMALNAVADALSETGDVFGRDDVPELVRDATPFGLKTYESILDGVPQHRGLLLATASGFAQYAYAFVVLEADRVEDQDLAQARELRRRAKKLFLRGRDYALRGLEAEHPGFAAALKKDPDAALAEATKDDAGLLYWAGACWAGALVATKDDLDLVAELPIAGKLVERCLALDETFGNGAAHEFMISFEGSRSEAMGGSPKRARDHYRRALEISGGKRASVPLALAESVVIRDQNLAEFRALVDAALAVDPDAVPSQRLANILAQRRAAWLKTKVSDLFLNAEPEEVKK